MTKPTTAVILATGLALLAPACGNLSNDDLVFLSAVPKPKEIELKVQQQDPNRGALVSADAVGEEAANYRLSHDLATGLNDGVHGILTLVDSLGKGYPPTERTDDARIWGPFRNADKKGHTMRLEIQREVLENGSPRFHFCLAMALDGAVTGEPNRCREADKNGFQTVLSGHYEPRTLEGGARSGAGEIKLDVEAARRANAAEFGEGGVISISYDFSQGGDAKQIHVNVTKPDGFGSLPQMMVYDYGRTTDGQVDFSFSLSNYSDPNEASGKPQEVIVTASWSENIAGRADATKRGGDLAADQYYTVIECWDENAKRTYAWAAIYKGSVQQLIVTNEGSAAACPP
jgi:hypothetical protein